MLDGALFVLVKGSGVRSVSNRNPVAVWHKEKKTTWRMYGKGMRGGVTAEKKWYRKMLDHRVRLGKWL